MLYSCGYVLVALGMHECEGDDLLALRGSMPGLEIRFCETEAEFSIALAQRRPDAIYVSAAWDQARLSAALHQIQPHNRKRIPVLLAGPASEVPLDANGSLEIHRFSSETLSTSALSRALGVMSESTVPPQAAPMVSEAFGGMGGAPPDYTALARFIGGIAHDFNNLLAAIMGEVQLAASRSQEERVVKHLDRANEACFRMATEIRKLLIFQESAGEKRGIFEVGQVLGDARRFVPELLGTGMDIEIVESHEPLWVEGSISGLRQILVNLVAYAGQQVKTGGTIRLGARRPGGVEMPSAGRQPVEGRVLIEVELCAESLSDAPRSVTHDAVFSRHMRDAGVSLAIVWKLVQDFDGTISVFRTPDGGSVFSVSLPLAHPAMPNPAGIIGALRGTETLLVVSTDRPGMESLARGVRQLGYRVEVASSPMAIAPLAKLIGTPLDCVLIDTDCENLDPAAAHETIRALAPRVPILLAAPELAALCRSPFSTDGLTCLVHKPLDIKEVLTTLRALVTAPAFSQTLVSPGG